jgi:hypothetical protein
MGGGTGQNGILTAIKTGKNSFKNMFKIRMKKRYKNSKYKD